MGISEPVLSHLGIQCSPGLTMNGSPSICKSFSTVIKNASNDSHIPASISKIHDSFDQAISVIAICLYSFVGVLALFGNILVCVYVWRKKKTGSRTNIFLFNLAIADITIAIMNMPWRATQLIMNEWVFGNLMCKTVNVSVLLSVYVSTFTMLAIALDRYRVVMNPMRSRMRTGSRCGLIAIIWILSMLLSIPFTIFAKADTGKALLGYSTNDNRTYVSTRCVISYPKPVKVTAIIFTVVTGSLQFIIPVVLIFFLYGRLARRLWSRPTLGQVTDKQYMLFMQGKRRSIKTMVIVVATFVLCWTPLNIFQITRVLFEFHTNFTYLIIFHWLAMSHSCWNPVIYSLLNRQFRKEMGILLGSKKLAKRFGCCLNSQAPSLDDSLEESLHYTYLKRKSILFRKDSTRRMLKFQDSFLEQNDTTE